MDHALSKEQQMLKDSAKEYLAKECPKELVREMEEDEKGYSPKQWRQMADLGWAGIVIPEKYGGMEMHFLDLALCSIKSPGFIHHLVMVFDILR